MPAIASCHLMCGFLNRAVPLHIVTKAKSNDLWAYINPSINGKKLFERPTKPKVSDFLKHIHQSR